LVVSELGVANLKGKVAQWHFAPDEIHGIFKDKTNPCKFEIRVIRRYQFEAEKGKDVVQICDAFQQLYNIKSQDVMPQPLQQLSPPTASVHHHSSNDGSPNSSKTPTSPHHSSQHHHHSHHNNDNHSSSGHHHHHHGHSKSFANLHSNNSLQDDKKIHVSIDSFELLKVIGKGSFSNVVLVRKKDEGKIYAMKILNKQELKKRNQVEHTITEREILSKHQHPFIVKLYYSFQTQDKLYMCLEYVNGGELFYHLKRARRFPENLAMFYAAEVTAALEYRMFSNVMRVLS